MAKCNFIVNIVTLLEVRLRPQAVSTLTDELLEGDFTQNIVYSNVVLDKERLTLQRLVRIRNEFVHEGIVCEIPDKDIEELIDLATSILTHEKTTRQESEFSGRNFRGYT